MIINIYDVNQFTEDKGVLVGVVSYKAQKLSVDSKYSVLDDLVNKVYKMMQNGKYNGRDYRAMKVHNIDTPKFVEAFGIESWKSGFMIELVE